MADVRLIDANALLKRIAHHTVHDSLKRITFEAANTYEQVKGDMFNLVQKAPVVDAVPVVRCRECKNGTPLPEEAMAEFSPGVMRCLAGRGDCDKYCTTWEDGFCDEGAKLDAKDMDVHTKDGGASDG
jgi:hypothetical protein